jgi:hypothetical protein
MLLLENLGPAPKIETPIGWKPAVEFDGTEGIATTPGLADGLDYTEFLEQAGYSPDIYEVIGAPRTSRWQVYDGSWRTSYRFHFRLKPDNAVALPLLYKEAKKTKVSPPKLTANGKALLVCWSDSQTGKVDEKGGTKQLIERILEKQKALEQHLKKNKYGKLYFLNVGDSIEGFESGGNPMRTNDLSLMEQVDLEATFEWETLRIMAKYAPVEAYSVGSNHGCWRSGQKRLGTSSDDWGLHIQRTIARLAKETGLPIKFYEPNTYDESIAFDVFGDKEMVVGLVHGHQANNSQGMIQWWRNQSHGDQPVTAANLLIHGHWHHLRIVETGRKNGRSRWIVQCPTLDNGSSWWRNSQNGGDDSDPGLLIIPLEQGKPFSGTVIKL